MHKHWCSNCRRWWDHKDAACANKKLNMFCAACIRLWYGALYREGVFLPENK
jgi:hypothetical protein